MMSDEDVAALLQHMVSSGDLVVSSDGKYSKSMGLPPLQPSGMPGSTSHTNPDTQAMHV
jgi:hypothetical protein